MNCTLTAFPTLSVMHNNGTESLEELLITVVYMARSPTMNVVSNLFIFNFYNIFVI